MGYPVLELNWYPNKDAYSEGDRLDHLAFEVAVADKAYRQLLGVGAVSAMAPFDEGRWRLAFAKDPDGAWIEIGSRIREKKKRVRSRRVRSA